MEVGDERTDLEGKMGGGEGGSSDPIEGRGRDTSHRGEEMNRQIGRGEEKRRMNGGGRGRRRRRGKEEKVKMNERGRGEEEETV